MPETIKREVLAWLATELEHAEAMVLRYSWRGNAKYKNNSTTRLHFEERCRIIRAAMVLLDGVPREVLEPDPQLTALLIRLGQTERSAPPPTRLDRMLSLYARAPFWQKTTVGFLALLIALMIISNELGYGPFP